MDLVDDAAADEVVLVFGPVGALEQVVGRLTECGVLARAAPVLPDAGNPARGSCVLRMAAPSGGRNHGRRSGRRTAASGFLDSLAAVLRRPGRDAARRPGDRPGRHRARAGS